MATTLAIKAIPSRKSAQIQGFIKIFRRVVECDSNLTAADEKKKNKG